MTEAARRAPTGRAGAFLALEAGQRAWSESPWICGEPPMLTEGRSRTLRSDARPTMLHRSLGPRLSAKHRLVVLSISLQGDMTGLRRPYVSKTIYESGALCRWGSSHQTCRVLDT